jgi:hypothetical protein
MAGGRVGRMLDYPLLESSGGFWVREQHPLQSLKNNTRPEYKVPKPERLKRSV